tara:strand:- start:5344 stop:5541 length:198 start_codon:yes stop_codon:yes gene_type:complete
MIYGFAYLGIVIAISAGWLILAVLPKPSFIEKPIEELKNKLRLFLKKQEKGLSERNILDIRNKEK